MMNGKPRYTENIGYKSHRQIIMKNTTKNKNEIRLLEDINSNT